MTADFQEIATLGMDFDPEAVCFGDADYAAATLAAATPATEILQNKLQGIAI